MAKLTGFMDYTRKTSTDVPPLERIENFNEFHIWLSREEQQTQAARCMDCGVPFCQAGMMIGGMASGCPLNNLIPEWNDLVYQGRWELALRRLRTTNRFPEFTSRVCPALCEAACTCGDVTGSSVTVRENEHAIVETGYAKGWLHAAPPPARTGKSVAVIGRGPPGRAGGFRSRQRPVGPVGGRIPQHPGPCRHRLRACRPCGRSADVRHPQHEAGQIRHRAPHQDHAG